MIDPFQTGLVQMPGVGTARRSALASAGLETVGDLLTYVPRKYLDRSAILPISDLPTGEEVTVLAKVRSASSVGQGKSRRFVANLDDGSGKTLSCVWFAGVSAIGHIVIKGETIAATGTTQEYRNALQMVHPELELLSDPDEPDLLHMGRIIPIYRLTSQLQDVRLNSRGFRRLVRDVLSRCTDANSDFLPENIRLQYGLPQWFEAVEKVHFPESMEEAEKARTRLAFDEFFHLELVLALSRHASAHRAGGISFSDGDSSAVEQLLKNLPYKLTQGQRQVVSQIRQDMHSPISMNRLLQGDVGSGKTVVAVLAMLVASANGYQSALMAPTEVLAEQHALVIRSYLKPLGLNTALLTASGRAPARRQVAEGIATGHSHVVVGTHALISEGVEFSRLGLVVIDEQHRFGVEQRKALVQKGIVPDLLVMTATPIPRTLAMTVYGELDVSLLLEKPANRHPIETIGIREKNRAQALQAIGKAVKRGEQAYIVYPLVEKSQKSDYAAATEGYDTLSKGALSGCRLGLLHGRMDSDERTDTMSRFKAGAIDVLVATTVIEVGVDVPGASVMLIESADRFGLSQLHQLRGRIGRSEKKSVCYLLVGDGPVTPEAARRIKAMLATDDGFAIAEHDLAIRGPGEVFGTRQAGLVQFRIADLLRDEKLLESARTSAFALIDDDPALMKKEHRALRDNLMRLYPDRMQLLSGGQR